MPGGKQHARHGQNTFHALRQQVVETVANDRTGELQVTVVHRHTGKAVTQPLRHLRELGHRAFIAAAMATDHDAGTLGQARSLIDGHHAASSAVCSPPSASD